MSDTKNSAESGLIVTVDGKKTLMAQFNRLWGLLSLDSQEKPAQGAQWVFGSDALMQFQSAHLLNPSYQVDHQRRFGANDIWRETNGEWLQVVSGTNLKMSFEQNDPSVLALTGTTATQTKEAKPIIVPAEKAPEAPKATDDVLTTRSSRSSDVIRFKMAARPCSQNI